MILVTGGSQGIGAAAARALLERGDARLLVTGRCGTRLDDFRRSLPARWQERVEILVSDQASRDQVNALAARIRDAGTDVEGAILAVGVNPMYGEGPRRIHSLSESTIAGTIETNCTHTLQIAAAVLQRLRDRRGGVLVFIGSRAERSGLPGAGLYCATKSFLGGLVRTTHHEYGPRGVRVHLLHPALVRTPRTAAVIDGFAAKHGLQVEEADVVGDRIARIYLGAEPAPVELAL